MKTFRFASGHTIEIPSTGAEWELFTLSMPCGRAAREMTSALERCLRRLEKHVEAGSKPELWDLYEQFMGRVSTKWSSHGAADSEPRNHAFDAMERAFKILDEAA